MKRRIKKRMKIRTYLIERGFIDGFDGINDTKFKLGFIVYFDIDLTRSVIITFL